MPLGSTIGFMEDVMRSGKHLSAPGLFLAIVMLMGAGSLLSACDTVAGAGQDISWFGNAVTSDAVQTERATPPPPY
jgi:predicted small secreted protein